MAEYRGKKVTLNKPRRTTGAKKKAEDVLGAELWSYEEAAEKLRISESTLRKWTAARKIPFVRVGRRVRFRHQELDDYIDSHIVRPETDTVAA